MTVMSSTGHASTLENAKVTSRGVFHEATSLGWQKQEKATAGEERERSHRE